MKKATPIIFLVLFLNMVGVAFAFSPCHLNVDNTYYCDLDNQNYLNAQQCFQNCYAQFENSDVQIHVSKTVIELFYLLSGVFVGILFILCILVGLR